MIVYTQSAQVKRLIRDSSDADREGYVLIQNIRVNIQPAGLEYAATMPDGAIGKYFKCYTTWSGCQIGMQMVTSGTPTISGMRYDITGVEPWSGPFGRHYELLIRKATD